MRDFFEDGARPPRRAYVRQGSNWSLQNAGQQDYTPSTLNAYARNIIEGSFPPIHVRGEVTGWKRYATSGHCYFTLRDRGAQVRCVMFSRDAARLPADPEEGMEVRVFGTLTLYERRGDFQLGVRELEAGGGDGLWRLAFEKLRRRLEGEGLLAVERKRQLPAHPATIGVVTSAAGAAFHDVLHVVQKRAPWTRVVLAPARVQGQGAAADIARALARLDRAGLCDVIIVGRGGGSIEDLWAFNEEAVARAIAACTVPVISAVGHEVDVTIADLVADYRAPTPSAAAERAVPDHAALTRETDALRMRMQRAVQWRVDAARNAVDGAGEALEQGIRYVIDTRRERAHRCAEMLDALSPLAALRRGYAVPLGENGRILRSVTEFRPGSDFTLRVADGVVDCRSADMRTIELPEATNG
ncbi:MAG: exodeoxyribonuclease VII large subunit [Longimicrobiales bacterium]